MKRLFQVAVLSLVLFAVSVPLVFQHPPVVVAVSKAAVPAASPKVTPAVTPTPAPVDYTLPYPGILPDNPLYVLKNLRDRIIELLISDPVNKTEFYILQADKKLNMALTLVSMNKNPEADKMLQESLDSRTQAVMALEKTVQSGRQIPGYVIEKLTLSLEKHEEVLVQLHRPTEAVTALMKKVAAFASGK